jgi:hypothetical protein
VDYPHTEAELDLMMSETIYLRTYPYIDDQHWRHGFDDALINRHKHYWTQLMVEKGDVRAKWPFTIAESARAGAPGRPTSTHLVLEELARRGAAGELEASIRQEAAVLSTWLSRQHRSMPQLSAKAISNKIGTKFRELRNSHRGGADG